MPVEVAISELQMSSDLCTTQVHVFERGTAPHVQASRHLKPVRVEQAVKGRTACIQVPADLGTA